ncbi:HIRAN domain-containing protein [Christiangramia aquimixticola]|uniref:HIRAN domain-containing protein n=1 Tax=Christiangramia aquimixticola TaxID=1697558 RepID=UPI003AA8B34A
MNKSILPITPGLLALLNNEETGILPFTQEIFLLEIDIAGTNHCKEIETVKNQIVPEKLLSMKREPDNKFDEYAIAIYCEQVRVGYVPAKLNLVCSRLMDAGKLFFCRVVEKEWEMKWLRITANVYMVE